jgi:hypothetical protein
MLRSKIMSVHTTTHALIHIYTLYTTYMHT